MASVGFLESLLNGLPSDLRRIYTAFTREAFTTLRFGAPASTAAACENLGGHLVPYVTSSTANREVAVAHELGRIPRLVIPCLPLDTVNATNPVLTITRAADASFLYIKSATTSASGWLYCE